MVLSSGHSARKWKIFFFCYIYTKFSSLLSVQNGGILEDGRYSIGIKWSWWTSSWSVTSACWSSSSAHARGLVVTNVRGRGRRRGWKWRELKLSQHIISCHKLSSQQNLAWWDEMGDGGKRLHKHRSQSVVQFLGFITKCSARLCNCLELFVH